LTDESNQAEPRTMGGAEEETPVVNAADPVAADSTETAEPEPATASVQPDAAEDTGDVVSQEAAPVPAPEPEPDQAEVVNEAEVTSPDPEPEPVAAAAIAVEPETEADAVAPAAVEVEADAQQPPDASADPAPAEATAPAQETAAIEAACDRAWRSGAFRYRVVKQLLKRTSATQQTLEFIETHPVIRPLAEYGEFIKHAIQGG